MSATGKQIAEFAATKLGYPYLKGGQGNPLTDSTLAWLRGRYGLDPYVGAEKLIGKVVFDCSGLVTRALITLGLATDNSSHNPQWYRANETKIKYEQLQPGDLCLRVKAIGGAYHIGIYEGNGNVIHAAGRKTGVIRTHDAHVWEEYRRVKGVAAAPSTPTTPPPTLPTKPNTYVVQRGDSWIRIAKMFGFKSYKDLVALNGGVQFGLHPGDVLIVGGSAPVTPPQTAKPEYYTVVAGDSWIRIAKRYGFSSYVDLIKLNGGKQFGLHPGMQLRVK